MQSCITQALLARQGMPHEARLVFGLEAKPWGAYLDLVKRRKSELPKLAIVSHLLQVLEQVRIIHISRIGNQVVEGLANWRTVQVLH
ncbi:hypothetical protein V6N11_034497 [Hibiscus sabdariffa]|uniref:RNase H type-1 domain-containing protein n=1 Tax=Hibiscus sabdariffa TaxID=183260 RepID=A0ABR1ZYW3_9ROSI